MSPIYERLINEYRPGAFPQYGQMAEDPQDFLRQIESGYTPSEGYQYKQNKILQAMRNAAASGGRAGTMLDQEGQGDAVRGLLGEDMQQYLNNVLGIQGGGLSGLERLLGGRERGITGLAGSREREAQRGFEASSGLANILSQNLSERGALGFQGSMADQMRRDSKRRDRNQLIGNALGAVSGFFGGGF